MENQPAIYILIELLVGCITFLTAFWKIVDAYFKSRKDSNQEFIQNVVKAALNVWLNDFKIEVNDKINKLFEYRESDRRNVDDKFNSLLKEVRK